MSEAECYPKADFFRKPNFPKFSNCGINTRDDKSEVTLIEFFESRVCPNIYRMFRSVDWTHDMMIVKWHLFIWHERKLCALTNAPSVQSTQIGSIHAKRVNDYQRYSMLTVLPLRSMSCTLGNSSSFQAAGDDHSCRYYNPLSAKMDILKNFLCI